MNRFTNQQRKPIVRAQEARSELRVDLVLVGLIISLLLVRSGVF